MVSKKIIIEEKQYQKLFERFNGGALLTEMPYSPSDYSSDCAVHAVIAYIHLGKLFLFGNSTNNGADWVKQTLNHHIIPMITAPYTSSIRSKSKMFQKGFIEKHFGMDYRDYYSVMSNFCDSAIDEVKKGDVRLYDKKVMPLISVEDAVNIGKSIIEGLMTLSVNLLSNSNANEVRNVLKPYLMKELKSKFNIEFDIE